MQRWHEIIRDNFGNPVSGAEFEVFTTGTTNYATIYTSTSSDNPTGVLSQPIVTGSDGRVAFAVNDGDYDLKITYPDASTWTRYRVNFFDSTTATTVPVSSISLAMPSQFSVSGSPGTAITVNWGTQSANTVFAGPTSGGAAAPTFRALVAADISGVAVALTGNQSAAGNKTWSGTATFSSTATFDGAATFNAATGFNADVTFGTNADVVLDKTSRLYVGAAGTNGWAAQYAIPLDNSVVSGTLPTATTMLGGLRQWAFSAAATNELQFVLVLPYDYAEGTDIYPFVQWSQSSTGAGNAIWGIEYSVAPSYDTTVFPATTSITLTDAAPGVAYKLQLGEFAAVTGTTFLPNTVLLLRVYRDGAAGGDTLADTAFLHAVGVHYESNRLFAKNKAPNFYT